MAIIAIVSGCSPVISDTLLSPAERRERSIEHARSAVKAQKSGNMAVLKSELEAAVAGRGGDARARADIGQLMLDFGRPDMAVQVIEPAFKFPPANVTPALWNVALMAAAKLDDKALVAKATANGNSGVDAITAQLERPAAGDRDKAVLILMSLDAIDFLQSKAINRSSDAIKLAEKLASFAKQSPLALSRCALAYAELSGTPKDLDKAVTLAEDAVLFAREQGTVDSVLIKLKDTLGWVHLLRGKPEDLSVARIYLREVVDDNPDAASPRYHLARTWEALGLLDRAITDYQRVLYLRPDDSETKQRLKVLTSLTGDSTGPVKEPAPAATGQSGQ
jgi:tetratricopeptide (TPR) repeat protein